MSAVISEQNVSNVTELLTPGPGERLRAARLAGGFDLAKIASELHLTSAVVAALEADDYAEVGARVFVRGYLRNYARIVGMPVESILRQFDERWPDEGAHRAVVHQSPRLPADGGPGRGLAGALTWLLLLGSVVLFLMWWRGYLDEIVPQQAAEPGMGVQGEPAVAEPESTLDPVVGAADGMLPLPSAGDDLVLDAVPLVEPPRTAVTLETLPGAAGAEPVQAAAPVSAAPVGDSPAGVGEGPVIEGAGEIVISFNAPSWVDVRDSERKFKLFGEMPKGTRKVLGGEPPYKLVIGNAQAVSISVNGQPFDLSPYAKGNVARFTLDP
jgi:cytoskeleton protein RodZ